MKNTLSKKKLEDLKRNAAEMPDAEFKRQSETIISAIVNIVKETVDQGKTTSNHFVVAVNKEIDLLSKMIESQEFTSQQKVNFANRVTTLVNKLHKKSIIKDISILAAIGALGVIVWRIIADRIK